MKIYPSFAPLPFFEELISCGHNLYSWTCAADMALLHSNCPYQDVLYPLLVQIQQQTQKIPSFDRPVIFGNALGLTWILDFEQENAHLVRLHLIGPVFHSSMPPDQQDAALAQLPLSAGQRSELASVLPQLPVLPVLDFLQYGLMLHYALTGEKIQRGEFQHHGVLNESPSAGRKPVDRQAFWLAEQMLMQQIESGNLDYRRSPQRERLVSSIGAGFSFSENPLRQQKDTAIVFTTLCCCAAIRGGLPPETSQALRDHYISSIEACRSLSELLEANAAMQDDFVQQVYQQKRRQGLSPQILQCCNYIQLHIGERIQLKALARHVGYAESYLTQKFRREMGQTLSEYILWVRMELAKNYLSGTLYSVQAISKLLGYSSSSYFSEQFKQYTGQSPTCYRRLHSPSV